MGRELRRLGRSWPPPRCWRGLPRAARSAPLRIGVIIDCVGIYRSLEDAELSGASLPLIERGAELRGRRASDGLSAARVAGRRVELVRGCTEAGEFSR